MAHRYLDEVGFVVHKDARDSIRTIHRQVREHYLERADRLERTLQQAKAAAEQARQRSGEHAAGRAAVDRADRRRRAVGPPRRRAADRRRAGQGGVSVAANLLDNVRRLLDTRRADPRAGPRGAHRRAARAHRRAAARRHRRQGQGRQVDAAQRPRRREGGADGRRRVHQGRHVVPQQPRLPRDGDPVGRPAGRAAVPAHRRGAGGRPRRAQRRRPAVRRRRVADRAAPRRDARRHARSGVDLRRHLDALAALPRHRRAGTRRGRRRHLPVASPAPGGRVVPRGVQGQHRDPRHVGERHRRHLPRRRDRVVADQRDGDRRTGGRPLPAGPTGALAVPGRRPRRRADRPGGGDPARGRGASAARHRLPRSGARRAPAAVRRAVHRGRRAAARRTRRCAIASSTASACSASASPPS